MFPSQFPKPAAHPVNVHEPVAHVAPVAFGGLHAAPHAPQFVVVLSTASQPFAEFPSQLPQPPPQPEKVHVPVAQLAPVAFGGLHAAPHAPQFVVVRRFVSHPFGMFPSQFPKPELHAAYVQRPAPHVAPVAFAGAHALPHAPQFVVVLSSASQPFAEFPSQLPQPTPQPEKVHVPVAQLAPVAFGGLHAAPHAPQFVVVRRFVSHPFGMFPSQFPKPEVQLEYVQSPVLQLAPVAFAGLHAVPQAPQFVVVRRLVSHPFGMFPSQFPKPELHAAYVQRPAPHVAPVAFSGLHAAPHAPQWTSELSDTSHPFGSCASQLPKPALHEATAQRFVTLHMGTAFARAQSPHFGTVRRLPQLSVTVTEPHCAETCAQSEASVAPAQPHTFASPLPPQVTPPPVQVPQLTVRVCPQLSVAV
jgi:hypothetical protein